MALGRHNEHLHISESTVYVAKGALLILGAALLALAMAGLFSVGFPAFAIPMTHISMLLVLAGACAGLALWPD